MFDLLVDVNECLTGEHNCSHNCSNTPGSFECKCRDGYSLDLDGSSCSGEYIQSFQFPSVRECAFLKATLSIC